MGSCKPPSATTVSVSLTSGKGNIGSTNGGLPFLEDEEIIEGIIEIAEQSPVLTMRGYVIHRPLPFRLIKSSLRTCFFVIGLISSTRMGAEILEEYGWISTRTPLGMTTGLCLPKDVGRFAHVRDPLPLSGRRILTMLQIEPWERPEMSMSSPPLPKLTGVEAEIMTAIANLSNYVVAAGAMNNLKRSVILVHCVR